MNSCKRPRVLHVVDKLTASSGVASVVFNIIQGVNSVTHDVIVYGECEPQFLKLIDQQGGKAFFAPDIRDFFGLSYRRFIQKVFTDNTYSLIHGHVVNSAYIYMREAKKSKIPGRLMHFHSMQSSDVFAKRIRNAILSAGLPLWVTDCIAVSKESIPKALKNQTQVIYNGIDVKQFQFNPSVRTLVRAELGIADSTVCIGNVARFVPIKNHLFLLDIVKHLAPQLDCVLVLVGDGPLQQFVKQQAKAKNLDGAVRFLGARNDAWRYYQGFDVFLLPSFSEGFPMAVLEAQCAGLPSIVTEHTSKLVGCHKETQFLPIHAAENWANAVLSHVRQQRFDGAGGIVSAKLDTGSMCQQIENLYQQILQRKE